MDNNINLLITLLIVVLVLLFLINIILLIAIIKINNNKINFDNDKNQEKLLLKLQDLERSLNTDLEINRHKSQTDIITQLNNFKEAIYYKVTQDVTNINEKVEERLKEGFNKSSNLFQDLNTKLTLIDSAQRNIEKLSLNVDELSKLLSDKKLRGIYGETQLYNILDNVFGEGNKILYEKQYKIGNSVADAVIHGHEKMKDLVIDSKFPLENFKLMNNEEASIDDRNQATKDFKYDLKKHIDTIKSKYIISNITSDQAIMFIPSEAVFSQIHAKYPEIIEYAQKQSVWITSPTTLVYMLSMILVISNNALKQKNAERILKELEGIFEDYRRLFERWDEMKKNIDKIVSNQKDLNTTVEKLNNKVYKIKKSDFDNLNDASDIE